MEDELRWRFDDPDSENHIIALVEKLSRSRCGRRHVERNGDDWVVRLDYDRESVARLLRKIEPDQPPAAYLAEFAEAYRLADRGSIELVITPDCDGPGMWLLCASFADDVEPNNTCWPLPVSLAYYISETLGGRSIRD